MVDKEINRHKKAKIYEKRVKKNIVKKNSGKTKMKEDNKKKNRMKEKLEEIWKRNLTNICQQYMIC